MFFVHHVKSSLSAQFSKRPWCPASVYINVSPDIIDDGKSFVNNVNKVGSETKPRGTHLT